MNSLWKYLLAAHIRIDTLLWRFELSAQRTIHTFGSAWQTRTYVKEFSASEYAQLWNVRNHMIKFSRAILDPTTI